MFITIDFGELIGLVVLVALLCYGLYLMAKGK